MHSLSDKVVLITGASSGIGAAAAEAFGRVGARVVLHYRSHRTAAEALVRQIEASGGCACAEAADVTDAIQIEAMVTRVMARFGRIDVLINSAGGFIRRARLAEYDDSLIGQVFTLNARSVVNMTRSVVPHMAAAGGGAIINVTTQAARPGGGPGAALYAASKAFVSTFTRAMAKELAADHIRVNAVAPGVIDTPFHDGHSSATLLQQFASAIPMQRLGTAEECAGAFLFLADAQASGYVTGQIIEVNGGQVMP